MLEAFMPGKLCDDPRWNPSLLQQSNECAPKGMHNSYFFSIGFTLVHSTLHIK